jgi:glucosamine 6-phosphate synthetase-like amidotransferase/phosphosugar isomerase protein
MLKEIFEIPQVFENAIAGRVNFKTKEITSNTLEQLAKENIQKIEIIAS